MKKIILTLLFTTLLFGKFTTLSTKQTQDMIKKGVVIIDIRRLDEFKKYGIIKTAHTLTFFDTQGQYNIPAWLKNFTKIIKNKSTPFIIYCAHANRSKVVGKFLSEQLHYQNVYELDGGIIYGWIDKGLKTVKYQ